VKPRVLITGGTGLIGSALTRELVAQGYHVIATGTSHGKEAGDDGVTLVTWDGRDTETLVPYLEGAAGVIHLAGSPVNQRWSAKGKESILRSRVESGSALAASIRKTRKRPRTLIQASTTGYYGPTSEPTSETAKRGATWLAYVCAHWEASTESVERLGVRRCIIRTAPVLARGGFLKERAKPFRWFLGGSAGDATRWVSWIALSDEVNAILFLLENTRARRAYNLASPAPVREEHFARALGDALKRPSWVRTPAWILRLLYGREQTEELILASSAITPTKLLTEGFTFTKPALEDALDEVYTS
jgi:hypothetical protein